MLTDLEPSSISHVISSALMRLAVLHRESNIITFATDTTFIGNQEIPGGITANTHHDSKNELSSVSTLTVLSRQLLMAGLVLQWSRNDTVSRDKLSDFVRQTLELGSVLQGHNMDGDTFEECGKIFTSLSSPSQIRNHETDFLGSDTTALWIQLLSQYYQHALILQRSHSTNNSTHSTQQDIAHPEKHFSHINHDSNPSLGSTSNRARRPFLASETPRSQPGDREVIFVERIVRDGHVHAALRYMFSMVSSKTALVTEQPMHRFGQQLPRDTRLHSENLRDKLASIKVI